MFHDVVFDAEGVPIVPRGVDEELWRLELPSILGVAWGGGRLLDSDSDDGHFTDSEGNESETNVSSCSFDGNVFSEADKFLRCHAVEHNVTWSSRSVQLGEYWSMPPEGHTYVLDAPPLLNAQLPSHPAELLAFRLLHRGSMHSSSFMQLVDVLPDLQKGKRRGCILQDPPGRRQYSFAVGAFALGGLHGIMHATLDFPWVTKLLVAVVRGCCYNHIFSAVALHCNQKLSPHVDVNNAAGRSNLLIPCSRWRGGGLWVSDNKNAKQLSVDSATGCVLQIKSPYIVMSPHVLHATMESWSGMEIEYFWLRMQWRLPTNGGIRTG